MSHHLKSERKAMKNKLSAAVTKPVPVKIVSEAANPVKPDKSYEDRERKWRAEEDLRTLQRAAEIKADRERMKYAKKCANDQIKALQKVK